MKIIANVIITAMTSSGSLGPLLTYISITLSSNVTFSSTKYCNAARLQKIWNLYKIINFRKFSGASNKTATGGLLIAAEPWKFLRKCQTDINWKLQKWSQHQFMLSGICQNDLVGGGGAGCNLTQMKWK